MGSGGKHVQRGSQESCGSGHGWMPGMHLSRLTEQRKRCLHTCSNPVSSSSGQSPQHCGGPCAAPQPMPPAGAQLHVPPPGSTHIMPGGQAPSHCGDVTDGSEHGGHGGDRLVVVVVLVSVVSVVEVVEIAVLLVDDDVVVVVRIGRGMGVHSWTALRGVTTRSANWSFTRVAAGTGGSQRSR